jgi:ATP-dependent Clp protease ATP-binding subunit ClpC
MGFQLKMSDAAKDFIAEKGYDIQFGARPLKRAIQKFLEDPMAEVIIKSDMKAGDTIAISFNKKKEEVMMKVLHAEEVTDAAVSDMEEVE